MKIEIERRNGAYLMEATNERGKSLLMDASVAGGGDGAALTPMEMLMAALGGCSAIDVIGILKKQRAEFKDIKATVTGEREQDATPALFVKAHVHFKAFGNVEEEKLKRAIDLSMQTYCSVAKTLERTAVVTSSYEIVP